MSAVLLYLSSQKVAGINVVEAKPFCNSLALSTFSWAAVSQKQESYRLGLLVYSRVDTYLTKMLFNLLCDFIHRSVGINSAYFLKLGIMINDGLRMLIENVQSFCDNLLIIIWTSTCLASEQKPFHQLFLFAIEVKNGFEIYPFCHYFLPYVHVLLASWEAI